MKEKLIDASIFPSEPGVFYCRGNVWRRFDGEQWYKGSKSYDDAVATDKPAKYAVPWTKRARPDESQRPSAHTGLPYGETTGWVSGAYAGETMGPGLYQRNGGSFGRFDGVQWFKFSRRRKTAERETRPLRFKPGRVKMIEPNLVLRAEWLRRRPAANGNGHDPANFAPTDLWSAVAHVQTIAEQAGYFIDIRSITKVEHGRAVD